MADTVIPDDLELLVLFESEPFYDAPGDGIISYAAHSPDGMRMEVTFDRLHQGVFVKILDAERTLVDFAVDGIRKIVLQDESAIRAIDCSLESAGLQGTVRIEISPNLSLSTSLMDISLNKQ